MCWSNPRKYKSIRQAPLLGSGVTIALDIMGKIIYTPNATQPLSNQEDKEEKMNDLSLKIVTMVKDLPEGTAITIPGRGEWRITLVRRHDGFDLFHYCPADDDDEEGFGFGKFFCYSTENNPHGAGRIIQEPSLKVSCRRAGVNIEGCIVGAIVLDAEGKVTQRFSWSKLVFVEKRRFNISSDGSLLVKTGQEENPFHIGYLRALFLPDKNRLDGYVGVFGPDKPDTVKVLEMEDLLLASL